MQPSNSTSRGARYSHQPAEYQQQDLDPAESASADGAAESFSNDFPIATGSDNYL